MIYFHPSGRITNVPTAAGRKPDLPELEKRKSKGFMVNYWQVADKAACLYFDRKNKVIFITLTFARDISHKEANRVYSKFIDNMKKTYKMAGYVSVLEFQKNGRPHFHGLYDIPKFNIQDIQQAWNAAAGQESDSSFDIGGKDKDGKRRSAVIRHPAQAIRYICKYATKEREMIYECRCMFSSHFEYQAVKITAKLAESLKKYVQFEQTTKFDEFSITTQYINTDKIGIVYRRIMKNNILEAESIKKLQIMKAESDFRMNICNQGDLFKQKKAVPVEKPVKKPAIKAVNQISNSDLNNLMYKNRGFRQF